MRDIITHMKTLWSIFYRLKNYLFDFIFPRNKRIKDIETMPVSKIAKLPRALSSPENFIIPIFSYKNQTVRDIVHQIKFKGNLLIASKISEIVAEEIHAFISETRYFEKNKKYILIPVPLSTQRLRDRGYNQAELMTKKIADHIPEILHMTNILIRKVNTDPQTKTRSRKERLANIKNCFSIRNSEEIHQSHIILFDDVTTTGATLVEAKKTLKKAGAKNVTAFTVAH